MSFFSLPYILLTPSQDQGNVLSRNLHFRNRFLNMRSSIKQHSSHRWQSYCWNWRGRLIFGSSRYYCSYQSVPHAFAPSYHSPLISASSEAAHRLWVIGRHVWVGLGCWSLAWRRIHGSSLMAVVFLHQASVFLTLLN